MNKKRYWTYDQIDEEVLQQLVSQCQISPIIAKILVHRGITTPEAAKAFLSPGIACLHDPFLLKDMDRAVERIQRAVAAKESIWIYGDYDVDGVSSTSLLLKYFGEIGIPVNYYIPHRMEEGYGINEGAIEEIKAKGGQLIITVDCGITSLEEAKVAKALGIDMIITDHHECQGELPQAYAVIDPKREDCGYPFKMLCGCGVAFKLLQALAGPGGLGPKTREYLEIVALATVADIVPLVDENRYFVQEGLKEMAQTKNLGIGALIKVCNLQDKKINSGHIGFSLAPRINAAGRLGDAAKAVTLLSTQDPKEAEALAQYLNEENRDRQQLEMDIFHEAVAQIEGDPAYQQEDFLVVYQEGWHHGVIGIVASRLVERYYKPTIVLSIDGEEVKGSGRSIPGVNLFQLLMECKELFTKFGGHSQAAGLSLKREQLLEFRKCINSVAKERIEEEAKIQKIFCDSSLDLEEIDEALMDDLEALAPFGVGNPAPKFYARKVRVKEVYPLGAEGKHLKLCLEKGEGTIEALAFHWGEQRQQILAAQEVDLVFTPEYNEYQGTRRIQLGVKDIKMRAREGYRRLRDQYFAQFRLPEAPRVSLPVDELPAQVIPYSESALLKVLGDPEGNLMLVNSLQGVMTLQGFMDIRRVNCRRSYTWCYGCSQGLPKEGEVHIIVNPHIDKIDFKSYNKIILFDPFFSEADFSLIFQRVKRDQLLLLFNPEGEREYGEILHQVIPQREKLVHLYKFFSQRTQQGAIGSLKEMQSALEQQYGSYFSIPLIQNALRIFQEGGLLTVEQRGEDYRIIVHQGAPKIQLETLESFRRLNQYLQDYEELKKRLYPLYRRRMQAWN